MSFLDGKLHLLFGGRHDWVAIRNGYSSQSIEIARMPYNILPGEGSRDGYDTAWSPRLGAVVQPEPWLSFYFSYSRSFGATNALPTPGQPLFAPQKGLQYEAGAKAEFLDGRLTATGAYFDIYKSGVVQTIAGTQFSQPVGLVRSAGVEFELAGRHRRQLERDGNLRVTQCAHRQDQNRASRAIVCRTRPQRGKSLAEIRR